MFQQETFCCLETLNERERIRVKNAQHAKLAKSLIASTEKAASNSEKRLIDIKAVLASKYGVDVSNLRTDEQFQKREQMDDEEQR